MNCILNYMSSKNIPLNVPLKLSKEIAHAAKNLNLPQSQCMRLAIQYGLPELSKRLSHEIGGGPLPKVAAQPWARKTLAGYDLDESMELDEDLL